jgi:hypothetical protein
MLISVGSFVNRPAGISKSGIAGVVEGVQFRLLTIDEGTWPFVTYAAGKSIGVIPS